MDKGFTCACVAKPHCGLRARFSIVTSVRRSRSSCASRRGSFVVARPSTTKVPWHEPKRREAAGALAVVFHQNPVTSKALNSFSTIGSYPPSASTGRQCCRGIGGVPRFCRVHGCLADKFDRLRWPHRWPDPDPTLPASPAPDAPGRRVACIAAHRSGCTARLPRPVPEVHHE